MSTVGRYRWGVGVLLAALICAVLTTLPDRVNAGTQPTTSTTVTNSATAARDPDALPGPVVFHHETDEDPHKRLVEPPTGLTAEQGRVDGEVKLSWNAPAPTDDIEHHDYRYHTGGRYSAWVTIPASGSSSNHVGYVSGLTGGVAHTFQVRAIATNGDPSLPSATATVTPRGAATPTSARGTRSSAQVVVTLELSPSSIDEGSGVSTVTASLDSASAMTLTVTVSAEAVAPAVAGDFTLSANRTLAIAAGDLTSTGSVTISAVDNTSDAPDKEVTVSATVAGATNITGPSDVTLMITDDDEAATLCTDGNAGLNFCSNVDLMSHLPIDDIGGGAGTDIWGWTDSTTSKEYAIMGRTTGTAFVDISDPLSPIYLGNLPAHSTASTWTDMKVYMDHAFIVSEADDSGMQVFDLTQLRAVASPPVTFSETAHYDGFSEAHNIAINEDSGFAYAVGTNTCRGGPHMINIQNPTNPTSAGCFRDDGYTHDAQCVNYIGPDPDHQGTEICFNSNPHTNSLTIVDVTNKAAPEMLSRTGYRGSRYTHQGWLTDDHAYFVLGDERDEPRDPYNTGTATFLWDVADLDRPRLVGSHVSKQTKAIDHNQYVNGKYTYQANYNAGLRIFDVTDIANGNLTEVAFFDMLPGRDSYRSYYGAWSNYPFFDSGILIVSTRMEGLFVLRPNLVDSIAPKVGRATVDRETLTLTYGEALDETSMPALDAFAVTMGDAARSVSGVSVSGSAVTLTLASAVTAAAEVTVTYTVPETSPIRDEAQNNAASLSSREVRNDTTGPPGTPGAPTVAAASATSLIVTWVEPNAKPPITDYDVQYRIGDSGSFTDWPHTGTALTATIPSLTEGTTYQVQVLARNPVGMSGWSEPGSGTPAPPPNIAPTASARATTPTTVYGLGTVELDGGATDPDGDTLTYAWTSSGSGFFEDAALLDTIWTAPEKTDAEQNIVLTLTVTDDGTGQLSHAAEVNVRVRENQRPMASVSPDTATVDGGEEVALTATASDPDTTTLTYDWTSSGGGTFEDAAVLETKWTAPGKTDVAQDITLTLTVADDGHMERAATETVQVTVRANRAPDVTATATTPTTVNGGGAVTLRGTANDPDGDGLTYTWSSNGGGSFDNATLDPTWTAPPKTNAVQNIVLTLTVTEDRAGARTETANVDVTVRANQLPRVTVSPATVTVGGGGTVRLVGRATDRDDGTLTYRWRSDRGGFFDDDEALVTPWIAPRAMAANERVVLTLTVTDSANASASATASVTVRANQAPRVTVSPATVTVDGGGTVTLRGMATDPEDDDLFYFWSSNGGGTFNDDAAPEATWTAPPKTDTSQSIALTLTVTDDGAGSLLGAATVNVTVRGNQPLPPPIIGGGGFAGFGGGGGGGGGGGPTPSEADFEWTVKRDIEELDSGHDTPTGLWSDGATLWILENGEGADDAVYAYDLRSGERGEEREFALAETNRAPRGFWSNGETVWVSDSGRERLFAYDLASGEREESREVELAERNSDARGIWSDEETMWVLDGGKDALFAYDLATGDPTAEYALDSTNGDPHGLFFDGVTFWVSDHGAKRLFAYRLETGEDGEAELGRNRDEEFPNTILSRASNNSPRGIWSDGDVMYVADESDDKVYTYNMPDAIDARLATLTLSGVDFGEFDPGRTQYEGTAGDGVTQTTVEATTVQRRTDVAFDPLPDADPDTAGHQVALQGVEEITVTVTSADGSRRKTYRVAFKQAVAEIALDAGWNTFTWPGADGVAIADVLRGDGDLANDISATVAALYGWDEEAGAWLAFLPGLGDVPGVNTLATLQQGSTYWVAVTETLTWTIESRAPDER